MSGLFLFLYVQVALENKVPIMSTEWVDACWKEGNEQLMHANDVHFFVGFTHGQTRLSRLLALPISPFPYFLLSLNSSLSQAIVLLCGRLRASSRF